MVTALAEDLMSVRDSTQSWTVPPRWATPRTSERPTYGHIVAAISERMGRPLMPHQRFFVDVGLEVQSEEAGDPDPGEWAYDDELLTGPRRVGKTAIITPVTAHRARLVQRARIFLTAQNRDKARKRWMDATDDVLTSPLRADVTRKIGNMNEELKWRDALSIFEPFAPNEDGLHSETPDLVWVDELWAFDAEQRRAIQAGYVPAFATTSGQAVKMSTAGTEKSVWLNDDRAAGRLAVREGVRLGRLLHEYALPDRVGGVLLQDLSDSDLIQACIDFHPAVCHVPGCKGPGSRRPCGHGFTVRPAAIRSAWVSMANREEFLRAYGNRSTADRSEAWLAVEESVYLRQIDVDGIPEGTRVALGVDADPEESRDAGISAGWRDPGGRMHVELIARRVGTRWAAPEVAGIVERQKPAAVAVANVGVARDIADQLEAAGIEVLRISQADVAAASVRHRDELGPAGEAKGSWFHRLSPELQDAAESAVWKAGKWAPGSGPISAWSSGTLAGWAYDHAPKPTSGRFVIG